MAKEEEINRIVPGDDAKEKVKKFHSWFVDAENERNRYSKRWERDRDIVRGKIDERALPPSQADTHINDIHAIIQRQVAILTDNRPAFSVTGREPQDDKLSEIMTALTRDVLDRNDMLYRLPESATDKLVYGTAIWKVIWDDTTSLGDVRYEIVNPLYLYPAPEAESIDTARYVMQIIPMTEDQIRDRWPKKWKDIKYQVDMGIQRDRNEPMDNKVNYRYTLYKVLLSDGGTMDLSNPDRNVHLNSGDLYKVVEIWYRRGDVGYRAYVVADVLLEDEEAPYRSFVDGSRNDQWPYALDYNVKIPHEFWGMGDVENLEKPQWAKTRIVRRTIDWVNHIVSPQVVIDQSTGVKTADVTNAPGAVIPVRPGTGQGIRWREVPPIPDGLFSLIGILTNSMETISGVTDVTQGNRPGSVVAATAIARLQEAAYTLMRMKSRNTEACMKRVGELTISRIQQFYTTPRIVRVTGENGSMNSIAVQMPTPGTNPPVIVDPTNGRFDLRVEQGSMLPVNKAARAELALELAKQMNPATGMPMYMTPVDVLKYAQFPDAEQLQERLTAEVGVVTQLKQQLQQAQQQIQQMQKEIQIQAGEGISMSQRADAEMERLKNNIESLEKELRVKETVYSAEHAMGQRSMKTDHVLTQIESDAKAKFRESQKASGPEAPKSGPRKNI